MNNYSIKYSINNITKNIIWRLSSYNLKKKPIFLFAHRRGGSTLLMESIANASNYRYSDQPLSITSNSVNYLTKLPYPNHYKHISFENKSEEKRFKKFFEELINGTTVVSAQWNMFDPTFHFQYDSSVIKLLNTNALVDWFMEKFPDAHFIYLSRNPINQGSSCKRNKWELEYKGYLSDHSYIDKYLNESQLEFISRFKSDNYSLENYVLNWVLDALPILKSKNQDRIKILKFEELVNSESSRIGVAKMLGLDENKFDKSFEKPSKSTKKLSEKKTIDSIVNKKVNPEKTDKSIDKKTRESIQEILNKFNIDLYEI